MKKIKENLGGLGISIIEIIAGILLLLNPVEVTTTIITFVGIIFIICGLGNILKYFKTSPIEALREQSLSKGLIILTIGIFCTFNTEWFIETFPIISILYGIAILLSGFTKVQWTIDSIRLKTGNALINGISAILTIIFAIIIINNPFATTTILWQFTGIVLIIAAILDIIAIFTQKKKDISY